MSNSVTALLEQKNGVIIRPRKALQLAYLRTRSQGSSTACIIAFSALEGKNVLRYVNLGDSGFILFRKNKFLYRFPVQQHWFNCLYQLNSLYLSGSTNTPYSAYEEEICVQNGDIVVAGTNGLFDNAHVHEIEEILSQNENDNPDKLARKIGELALSNSKDKNYFSPFAKAAEMEGIIRYNKGGKLI